MGDDNDLNIDKEVDNDYIDVEKQRADIATSAEKASESEKARSDAPERDRRVDEPFDMTHLFDTGSGNGAASWADEHIDAEAIIEHDGRASTRTFFYPEQAPKETRQQYERLIRYQEDAWSGMKNAQRAADRRRWVDTFTGFCGMTDHQGDRVEYVVEDIQMSYLGPYGSQEAILAIMSIVANEDGRFIRDEDCFRKLVDDVGTDLYRVKRLRKQIRGKTDRL